MPQKTSQIKTKGKNIQNGPFGISMNAALTQMVCQVPHKIQTVTEIDLKTLPPLDSWQG